MLNLLSKVKSIHSEFRLAISQINEIFLRTQNDSVNGNHQSKENELTFLPGGPYSTVALPLDYSPSRNLNPRWGYSHPPIPQIASWLNQYQSDYLSFVSDMFSNVPDITTYYDESNPASPSWFGGAICTFDSLTLYTMIRKLRPSRYVEIGSGMTTLVARKAVDDFGLRTKIVSIDPHPRQFVDSVCNEIERCSLEDLDLSYFDSLESGDILFLDGSHRSFMNSDVTVFFIDLLPRLKPGVIIHIHDITLPFDYPESYKHWYWNEQYLLAVYLMGHLKKCIPIAPTAWMCRNEEISKSISKLHFDFGDTASNDSWFGGGSFWFTQS
jgi:Methyltransferase domain